MLTHHIIPVNVLNMAKQVFSVPMVMFFFLGSLGLAEESEQVKKVALLFNNRCQKCHNAEVKDGDLDLSQLKGLGKYRALINLSDPAKSELMKRIVPGGGMPKGGPALSKEEVALVLEWIKTGAPDETLSTGDIKEERRLEILAGGDAEDSKQPLELQILRAILNDLSRLSEKEALQVRYLTLTHLWIAGESDQKMEEYRQGITKLLNSLSWRSQLSQPIAIDKNKTILRFRLDSLGWSDELWNKLVAENPYQLRFNHPVAKLVSRFNPKAPVPFLRADWFSQTVSRPPFYEEILQLPKTTGELEKQLLKVNVERNIREGKIARAGFRKSNVSGFNRLIERHDLLLYPGYYWKSYDFDGNAGEKDLFKNPLTFKHAGGEIIFSLPNGLQGYWLEKADGTGLPIAPTEIVADTTRRDTRIFNGISCMGCHVGGLQIKFDNIRDHVERTANAYNVADLKRIQNAHKLQAEMAALFKKDIARYQAALDKIGVKESGKLDPIRTLVDRFEAVVDIENAAAELGISIATLKETAKQNIDVNVAVSELENGGLPRDTFIAAFTQIASALKLKDAIPSGISFEAYVRALPAKLPVLTTHLKLRREFGTTYDTAVFPNISTPNQWLYLNPNNQKNYLSLDSKFSDSSTQFTLKKEFLEHHASLNGKFLAVGTVSFQAPFEIQVFSIPDFRERHSVFLRNRSQRLKGISDSGEVAAIANQEDRDSTTVDVIKLENTSSKVITSVELPIFQKISLSPDGSTLVYVIPTDQRQTRAEVTFHKASDNTLRKIDKNSLVTTKSNGGMSFSKSGKFFLLYGSVHTDKINSAIYLYDVKSGKKAVEILAPDSIRMWIYHAIVREEQKDIIFQVRFEKNYPDPSTYGVFAYSFETGQFAKAPFLFSDDQQKFSTEQLHLSHDGKFGIIRDQVFKLDFKY